MAGEQDRDSKPKATLIKHRKEEGAPEVSSESHESAADSRIKVVRKKVVVKPRGPNDVKPQTDTAQAGSGSVHAAHTENNPPQQRNPAQQNPRVAGVVGGMPSAHDKQRDLSPRQGVVGGRYVGPPKREPEKRPFPDRERRDGPGFPDRPRTDRPEGQAPGDRRFERQGPPAPYQGQNAGQGTYQRITSGQSYQGGQGPRGDNRGPGQGGYGPRPGGPQGGPYGQRSGPGQRPSGPRPGFPPKPGSGMTPPPGEEGKGIKKFVKAKKPATYQKKKENQEKELQIKQKKSAMKANPIPKSIDIMEVVTVSDLARKMNLKASDLISKLIGMGMMVTINQQIDAETASILASDYDCKVNIVSLYDETIIESQKDVEGDVVHRAPVVTIMGHVDHGKTKLLDAIRSTNVAGGEAGGITQHIGAYQVVTERGKITFIDTPGHEAFTAMRARGAQVTDIVVLVVAANDGVMPQTVEAIRHAQEGNVPIIVAVNKVDLPEANIERVKQQLAEYSLLAEDWGGTTAYYPISALKKQGLDELLEGILLQAEILELTANANCRAEGKVIESRIDQGRGIVATVLIERGKLSIGDSFVAGIFPGRVRAMFTDKGAKIETVGPSDPVEILGFTGVPEAGDPFQVTEGDKHAREIGEKRQELKRLEEAKNVRKITLDNLYDSILDGEVKELKVIIKGDVHGSVEAIQTALEKLSTKEIRVNVILSAAGAINESDVRLASASNAIIIGFHVRPSSQAQLLADQEKVEIRKYSIIYDVVEDMRNAMEGMLSPELREEQLATVEVRDLFKVPKIGTIAGCYVLKGTVKRSASLHLVRDGIEIHTAKISSLRRFKDDARQVEAGFECGIGMEDYQDIRVGDIFEVFEMKEIAKKLGKTLIEEAKAAEMSSGKQVG